MKSSEGLFWINHQLGDSTMKVWKRPVIREIQVGMEINLYVCADL
jgi:coenzyme PQQ precursor peptide PqqA